MTSKPLFGIRIIAATAAAKKAACRYGPSGPAVAIAFTAAQAAETALKLAEIKFELDGVTYESEIANAAPMVANTVVELIKTVGFLELMKLIKCFAAGTQVVVATEQVDGRWRYRTASIETLKEGDLVVAREEYGPQVKLQRIEETFVRISDHLRVLQFRDTAGRTQTIKTTDEHPFWSQDQARYVLACDLTFGTTVVGPNEEIHTLIASNREEFDQGILVYNFRVSEYHTYYVSEAVDATPLLVHNAVYAKRGPKTDSSAPHNAKIRTEAQKLRAEGNTIESGGGGKERLRRTPGGIKQGRRADIEYRTPSGVLKGRNIGKTKRDGSPVKRELEALDDLNGPGGLPTDFVPYDLDK